MIQSAIADMKKELHTKLGEKSVIVNTINALQTEIDTAKATQDYNTKLSMVLQKAAEVSRSNVKTHLETIGTSALQYVFGSDLSFEIDIQECRGRPEAEFYIVSQDGPDSIRVKPEDATGGGLVDVLATALRFAFIQIMDDPKLQGTARFDEPGKMVSEVASYRMAQLLKELTNSFDRQTIMVSHNNNYSAHADKKIEVVMQGSRSKVISSVPVSLNILQQALIDTNTEENI